MLSCPRCRQWIIVDVQKLHITVIKEPSAKKQSR
ncbi:cysteine-rich KTR domain-containing protein [Kineothrix alysoides]